MKKQESPGFSRGEQVNRTTWVVATIATIGYVAVAIGYAVGAWRRVETAEHARRRYAIYHGDGSIDDAKVAHATAMAYRDTLAAPAWPLMLASDVAAGFRVAKEQELTYLLEPNTWQMAEAQAYIEKLEKARETGGQA